jgi:hypothetical protein
MFNIYTGITANRTSQIPHCSCRANAIGHLNHFVVFIGTETEGDYLLLLTTTYYYEYYYYRYDYYDYYE